MTNVSDIIDALGGNAAMARVIAKGASTVSEMRRRQRIDVKYWQTLRAAASDPNIASRDGRAVFDLSYDTLVDVHTPAEGEAERPSS